MHPKRSFLNLTLLAFPALVVTCNVARKTPPTASQPTSPIPAEIPVGVVLNPSPTQLTPEQSLRSFRLPPGYRMELVASDPMIREPVALAWDGNGVTANRPRPAPWPTRFWPKTRRTKCWRASGKVCLKTTT